MSKIRKPRIGKLNTIGDCRAELGAVYRSARREQIDTLDALRLSKILYMIISAIRDNEFESRLTILEARHEQQTY